MNGGSERMEKKKKTVWIIVLIVCVLIVIVGGTLLIRSQLASDTIRREDVTPASADEATVSPDETTAQATAAATEPSKDKSFGYKLADAGDLDVDFAQLKSINNDIYDGSISRTPTWIILFYAAPRIRMTSSVWIITSTVSISSPVRFTPS